MNAAAPSAAISLFAALLLGACADGARDVPQPRLVPPTTNATVAQPAPPERTLRFSVLMMDHVAGGSTVTIHPDGSRDATFEFNDRGRGPKQQCHWEITRAGTLARLDIEGVDYLKQPVEEHLRSEGGKLVWNNHAEHGEANPSSAAAYVPINGAPDLTATLARALLLAPNHELPLLPAGSARLTRAGDAAVDAGGRSMHVVRYEIEGLDFSPSPVWLDDDSELFAVASPWESVVREGWDTTIPNLNDIQREAESRRLGAIAKKLAHTPPAAGLAIVHARLFDVETMKVVPDATIVVRGDRIVARGPAAQVKVPADAETLDAGGKTAIPGLWDMHSHVFPLDGLLDIANGVTGARDLGNDSEATLRNRQAWDSGAEIGPRMVLAGFIDGRGPFQAPTKVFADDEAEGLRDIDAYVAKGYEQIKLYSSLKPELVAPLAAYAHKKGLRVSGHVPAHMTAEEAVNAGYDEIQHSNFLFLNFLATKDDDTRTPLRFTLVAQKAAALDLTSAPVRRFVKLLADHKTVIDANLVGFEGMFEARQGQVDPTYTTVAPRLPVQVRRGFLNGGLPVPEGMDATYRASFKQMQAFVKVLFDAGVRIVAGTDALAGFTLARELELYVEAGIPAPSVIALATIGAARVMRHDKEWGSIAPGKLADIVLVDGKPDARISDVRNARVVIKGGVVYTSADLLRALGVEP